MFDTNAWLNQPLQDGLPRHQRICYLVVANGGFIVRGWGITSHGGGHDQGLDQNDALDLMQFAAFMDGLQQADVPIFDAFKPYYDIYVAQLSKEG